MNKQHQALFNPLSADEYDALRQRGEEALELGAKSPLDLQILSIGFSIASFPSFEDAKQWAMANGFEVDRVEVFERITAFRQYRPLETAGSSFTIDLKTQGVIADLGWLRKPRIRSSDPNQEKKNRAYARKYLKQTTLKVGYSWSTVIKDALLSMSPPPKPNELDEIVEFIKYSIAANDELRSSRDELNGWRWRWVKLTNLARRYVANMEMAKIDGYVVNDHKRFYAEDYKNMLEHMAGSYSRSVWAMECWLKAVANRKAFLKSI